MFESRRIILHVDVDGESRRGVAAECERRGVEVVSLNEPQLTIDRLTDTACRLVLLDLNAPGSDGLERLEVVKRFDGGIGVIVLVTAPSMTTVLDAMRLGAEACFVKPLDDYAPLFRAIDATFEKSARWRRSLEQLNRRRSFNPTQLEAEQAGR